MSILSQTQRDSIYDAVYGYVTGCPSAAIMSAIDMTVDDFIRDVGGIVFRDMFNSDDRSCVWVDAPFGGRVSAIRSVSHNGRLLNGSEFIVVQHDDGSAEIKLASSRIAFVNGACNAFHVCGMWMPTNRTKQLPSYWFDANFDGLRNGTLVNLFSQVKSPWGDATLFQKFNSDYQSNMYEAIRAVHDTDNRGGQLNVFDPTNDWTCGGFL